MISNLLVDTGYLITSRTNEGGDLIQEESAQVTCRFREINDLSFQNGRDQLNADAMVWFAAGTSVALGDIFLYGNDYYRIDQMLPARGDSSEVEFIKCGLMRHRGMVQDAS